jgi:hypothetical protein
MLLYNTHSAYIERGDLDIFILRSFVRGDQKDLKQISPYVWRGGTREFVRKVTLVVNIPMSQEQVCEWRETKVGKPEVNFFAHSWALSRSTRSADVAAGVCCMGARFEKSENIIQSSLRSPSQNPNGVL